MILLTSLIITLPQLQLDLQNSIKYLFKHFSDYLPNESDSTIFLQPTDQEELTNIISSLNTSKSSGPNIIPYRILFLLKSTISKQLADLFFNLLYIKL